MKPLDRVGGAHALPLAVRQSDKGEEPVTGFLEAVGYRLASEPPFADEGPSALPDFRERVGVDHVGVVG